MDKFVPIFEQEDEEARDRAFAAAHADIDAGHGIDNGRLVRLAQRFGRRLANTESLASKVALGG